MFPTGANVTKTPQNGVIIVSIDNLLVNSDPMERIKLLVVRSKTESVSGEPGSGVCDPSSFHSMRCEAYIFKIDNVFCGRAVIPFFLGKFFVAHSRCKIQTRFMPCIGILDGNMNFLTDCQRWVNRHVQRADPSAAVILHLAQLPEEYPVGDQRTAGSKESKKSGGAQHKYIYLLALGSCALMEVSPFVIGMYGTSNSIDTIHQRCAVSLSKRLTYIFLFVVGGFLLFVCGIFFSFTHFCITSDVSERPTIAPARRASSIRNSIEDTFTAPQRSSRRTPSNSSAASVARRNVAAMVPRLSLLAIDDLGFLQTMLLKPLRQFGVRDAGLLEPSLEIAGRPICQFLL